MPNRNSITICGHLGKDPVERVFDGGGRIMTFGLATNNAYKDRKTGDWKERPPTWHNIVVRDPGTIDAIQREGIVKGSALHVEGKLQEREFEDKKTGEKRMIREVFAYYVAKPLYTPREKGTGGDPAQSGAYEEFPLDIEEADIPF